MNILVCSIEDQLYGLQLNYVTSVILAVNVRPIPDAPSHILGAINVHGQLTSVINMRKVFGLPLREVDPADQFILCTLNQKPIALWVDAIKQVKDFDENQLIPAQAILPDQENLQYVLKDETQMILLYDFEKLLAAHHAI